MEPLLSIEHIAKSYGDKQVLNNINITINQGEIYGLLGPNGAGKTTLLRILHQIIRADRGQVVYKGRRMSAEDCYTHSYLPEERGLYPNMEVGRQLLFFGKLKGLSTSQAKQNLRYWLGELEISHCQHKRLYELSKGMQQKIQFLAAVISNPSFLILDEPFSGFDPVNVELITRQVRRLQQQGCTLLVSTHQMNAAQELCDYVGLLKSGSIIEQGTLEQLQHKFYDQTIRITLPKGVELDAHDLDFSIRSILPSDLSGTTYTIEVSEAVGRHQLLQRLIEHYPIISFMPNLPTLHQIYLQRIQSL